LVTFHRLVTIDFSMPSILYSTAVLALLELEDENGHTAWNNSAVIQGLGIESCPARSMKEGIPHGLDSHSCGYLAIFLDSVRNRSPKDRVDFIESGSDCAQGHQAWRDWFRGHITKKLNHLVESQLVLLGHSPTSILAEGSISAWPSCRVHVGPSAGPIVFKIFGSTVEDENGNIRNDAFKFSSTIIMVTFARLKKQWGRAATNLVGSREKVMNAMRRMSISIFLDHWKLIFHRARKRWSRPG
jgi:hypothetical protein